MARFTDEDEGKPVVNADGEKVGIVKSVEGGTAYVDPDPNIADTFKSAMGWGDSGEDTYALKENNVEAITDREIQVRRL